MKNKKILIGFVSLFVIVIIGVVYFINSKNFPLKNDGKYLHCINYSIGELHKDLKKAKITPEQIQYLYSNVIYEKEESKEALSSLNDSDVIAEYLVCLVNDIDGNSDITYYLCKVPYVKYKDKFNDEIAKIKTNWVDVLNQGVGGAVVGAKGAGTAGAAVGTVAPGVGNVIGGTAGTIGGGVIGFFAGAGKSYLDQDSVKKEKLQELINELPEENYKQSLVDFAETVNPNVQKINDEELNNYLTDDEIKLLYKTIKRFNPKK